MAEAREKCLDSLEHPGVLPSCLPFALVQVFSGTFPTESEVSALNRTEIPLHILLSSSRGLDPGLSWVPRDSPSPQAEAFLPLTDPKPALGNRAVPASTPS